MLSIVPDFFETIFPQTCILCGKLYKNSICIKCEKRISKFKKLVFVRDRKEIERRLNCGKVYFDSMFYFYEYKGLIRKIIINYKFNNKSYFCNFFAKMLLNCKKTYGLFLFYDIIIPVPMEKKKELRRGYNQAKLVTDIISKNTNLASSKDLVIKIKNTKTQSTLNLSERQKNVKDAFFVKNVDLIKNKNVIIFDDICTTGNTVNEMAKVLKKAGAKDILVLVLAKD